MSIEAGLMKRMTPSLHFKIQDSHKSYFYFSKSFISTIPTKTSTYTMILFNQSRFHFHYDNTACMYKMLALIVA